MRLGRRIVTVAAASALVLATAMSYAGPADAATSDSPSAAAGNNAVPDSTPRWLGRAQHLGAAAASAAVNFRVYLAPRGGVTAVKAAVAAVSTPASAGYRDFITPETYHRTFDPAASTVTAVRNWLAADGLTVQAVGQYNAYLQVSGTVAQAETAFSTTVARYAHDGVTVQANMTSLMVPAALGGSVLTVTGVDTTPSAEKPMSTPPPPDPVLNNAHPCSLYYGQLTANFKADLHTPLPTFTGTYLPYAVCGYTGSPFRDSYEGLSELTGSGVTVGIIDPYAAPTLAADADTYAKVNGDGSYTIGQLTEILPDFSYPADCGNPAGWYQEQSLDVEAVHAMAPQANIRYYGAASCEGNDILAATTALINQNQVELVTSSDSEPEGQMTTGLIAAEQSAFLQGALQGISFVFPSGDNGDELANTGTKQTDYPASDPYVTAVGGTSTAIGDDGFRDFRVGWGTQKYALSCSCSNTWKPVGFLNGAGGGYSSLFNRPDYQLGVVPSSATGGRAVPDVAMDADPTTGMLIGSSLTFPGGTVHYSEYRIGGTSLASSLFAGMTAELLQYAGRLGFLNPTIYRQYTEKKHTFTDVYGNPRDRGNVSVVYANGMNPSSGLLYSVRTFNQDSSLTTTPGWDDVTGIGSPNGRWLTSVSPSKK